MKSKPKSRTDTRTKPGAKPEAPTPAGTRKPKLLSGGNPQIAKADGDAPVQAYIAAMPGWKREASPLDAAQCTAWVKLASRLPEWKSLKADERDSTRTP